MLIEARYLKVCLLFAAKNDVRKAINGVLLEVVDHNVRLVATDGARICIFNCGVDYDCDNMQFLIPRESIDNLRLKNKGQVKIDLYSESARIQYDNVSFETKSISGYSYPPYRRCIFAGEMSGINAQFCASYLSDLEKCYKILNNNIAFPTPYIVHNGKSPALIDLNCKDFTGFLIPINTSYKYFRDIPKTAPEWALQGL